MENGISGTVYVSFVVNRRGEIAGINIIRGVDPSLDEEVIKALKGAPKWEPGKQRGKPVNVSFSIPIKFILQ
jgi:protein TonB